MKRVKKKISWQNRNIAGAVNKQIIQGMNFENIIGFARGLDKEDSLKGFRDELYIPTLHGKDCMNLARLAL